MLERASNQSERSTTQGSETDAPSTTCTETVSKANHNKFSILHFLPPLTFWAIKFKIKETGRAKWQKKVKLKSCLPPLAQADTIYFS